MPLHYGTTVSFIATNDEKEQMDRNAKARGLTRNEYRRLSCLLLLNDDYPITNLEVRDAY